MGLLKTIAGSAAVFFSFASLLVISSLTIENRMYSLVDGMGIIDLVVYALVAMSIYILLGD